jgi:uncharacterized protein
MERSTDWPAVLIILLVMILSSAVHGAVGYGLNIMAGPIVVLLEPRLAPGPLLVAGFVLTLLVLLRERRGLDLRGLSWMIGGRVLGTTAATLVLAALTGRTIALVFGGLVLAAVWMSLTGLHFPSTRPVKFAAGVASGIMGTLAAIGGPPAALVYQDRHGSELRSTLSGFFVFGSAISLSALFLAGKFGRPELELSLLILPGVVLGFLLSPRLIRHLDARRTRLVVLGVSMAAGGVLLVQAVFA